MTDEQYLKYEPMLIKIANKYKNNPYNIDIDDIFQIGSLGMIRAFDTYQENKEIKFSTYVYNCISWSIRREFHNLKRIKQQYTFTSLDYEIDDDSNMYDIIPNCSINVEYEALEEMTLKEYIQEFKEILTPNKANIFIDRYVNELQIKDISLKYNKTDSAIGSILRQSRIELIRKSFRIRKEYDRYIKEEEARANYYNNPSDLIYRKSRLKEMYKDLHKLEEKQIKKDKKFISHFKTL